VTAAGPEATDVEVRMHGSEYPPPLSPIEAMLEELNEARARGDADREAELRQAVEADLSARERAWGLS
jgi:hypothetical protein